MFTLDPISPLTNAILECVSLSPRIKVSDLHKTLRAQKIDITLQHLYRIINKMVSAQMMIKEHGNLSLNRLWIRNLGLFADSAIAALEKKDSPMTLPSKEGQHVTLTADSLSSMQAVWYDLLVHLREHLGKDQNRVYKYYSHAWWLLLDTKKTARFYKAIASRGITCYWLLGNDTFLDRLATKDFQSIVHISTARRAVFPTEGYNVNVYGDYVLECIFPSHIGKHLELLFTKITSTKDYDPVLLEDIFTMKAKFSIKLWKNKKLAVQLEQKIRQFF